MRESFGALREREFRLLFTGQLISLLGDSFTSVALAFAVLSLGSATSLGLVFTARSIPLVGFLLVGGVFADRLPRRTVMLVADVTRMGCQAGTAALVLTHTGRIWEIAVLQAVSGAATAFFNPASTGLTPMTVSEELLQQANALRGISMSGAGLVGLALGGLVVTAAGPGWALAVDAATFGASALFLSRLRLPPHVKLAPQSFLSDLRDGWREFTARTWVWVIVIAASLGNMFTSFFAVLGALVSKESLGGALAWTLILVGMSVGSLGGGFIALRVRVRRPLLFGASLVSLVGLPLALLALRLPALVVAAGAVLAGGGNMVFNSLWETTLQQRIPRASLSRVSAYDWFGSLAFQPLGLAIAGPLAAGLGLSTTLWIAFAGTLVVSGMCLATPSVRQLESS
ncbi:MAG TPA: MFS transporter [Gaiellaceae bacterium]|nr:MFS transporter [Gaiellaceae bacterium]